MAAEPVLNQKGANGIIAEYAAALRLTNLLESCSRLHAAAPSNLVELLSEKVGQFSRELTESQIKRAHRQGVALGDYLFRALSKAPSELKLPEDFSFSANWYRVTPTGHYTIKENSGDMKLELSRSFGGSFYLQLPISLKAYRGTVTSQGSKGGRAALTRLFLFKSKCTDEEFVKYFGSAGIEFIAHLGDFKETAKEFYESSEEGAKFIAAYQARKGRGAKVNNPLRRKEVGEFFRKRRGFLSEHRLAVYFCEMYNQGFLRIKRDGELTKFREAMLFVLGMENDIITLNAVCEGDDPVRVENSVTTSVHERLRRILLDPNCTILCRNKPDSSIISVAFESGADLIELNLAVWKDGTIQFKLDSDVEE